MRNSVLLPPSNSRRTTRGTLGRADKRNAVRVQAFAQVLENEAKMLAGVAGLEPVTSAVTGQRSNQLSYTPAPREQKGKKTFRSRQRASRGTGNDSGSRRQGGGGGEPR